MPVDLNLYAQALTCPSDAVVGNIVYLVSGIIVAVADSGASGTMPAIGFIVSKPSPTSCLVAAFGDLGIFSGLTPGAVYYASTEGAISATPGTVIQPVGVAKNASTLTLFADSLTQNVIYVGGSGGNTRFGPAVFEGDGENAGLAVDVHNNVIVGSAALLTTATNGFFYSPTCAGTPTGVPATLPTGSVPVVVDTTALKIWVYTGGAWHFVALT